MQGFSGNQVIVQTTGRKLRFNCSVVTMHFYTINNHYHLFLKHANTVGPSLLHHFIYMIYS